MAKRERWDVWVTYEEHPDMIFDEALTKTARLHHGRELGSGFGGGGRDVHYDFRTEEDAGKFGEHIQAYYKISDVKISPQVLRG